jgi:hypothetical protein
MNGDSWDQAFFLARQPRILNRIRIGAGKVRPQLFQNTHMRVNRGLQVGRKFFPPPPKIIRELNLLHRL